MFQLQKLWVTWQDDLLSQDKEARAEAMQGVAQVYGMVDEAGRMYLEEQMNDVVAAWACEPEERFVRRFAVAYGLLIRDQPIPLRVLLGFVRGEAKLVEASELPGFSVSAAVLDRFGFGEAYPAALLAPEDRRRPEAAVLEDIASLLIVAAENLGFCRARGASH